MVERARYSVWLPAAVGALAICVVVVASGRAPVPVGVRLPGAFWGLLRPASGGGAVPAVLVLIALAVLLICWWAVLRWVGSAARPWRGLAAVAAAWTIPVLLAPPLLSMDAYAYLAQGRMLATGLDPYQGGPVLLVDPAEAGRVDPMWRSSPVPYGPLALALLRAVAIVTQDLTVGVMLLRLLAIAGVVVATAGAISMARAHRRPGVFALTALNPITVIHLVGGAHLDAVLAALVVTCLVLAWQARWASAALLAAAAVAVKASAGPLLLIVVLALRRSGMSRTRIVALVLSAAVLLGAVVTPIAGRPWGFVPALLVPGAAASWYVPSTWAASLFGAVTSVLGLGATAGQAAGRLAVLLVGAGIVLWCARADLTRRQVLVHRASVALLVASLSLPAAYGWYLAAGLFGLAAVAGKDTTRILVLLCSALMFSSLPQLYDAARWPLALAWAVVLLALALAGSRLLFSSARRTALQTDELVRHRRLHLLTSAGMVVLAVAAAVGLSYTPATAGADTSRVPTEWALRERGRLVKQLHGQYPKLQIARLDPVQDGAGFRVQMVRPGVGTCEILLVRVAGPLAPMARLVPPESGALRAAGALSCPPPVLPP